MTEKIVFEVGPKKGQKMAEIINPSPLLLVAAAIYAGLGYIISFVLFPLFTGHLYTPNMAKINFEGQVTIW